MDNIDLISTPISEAWPMWLMFFLLMCIVSAEILQPGTLQTAFRSTFTRMERTFGDRATNFMGSLFLNTFRLGILAMALYVITFHGTSFSIVTYGYIVLLILAVILIKFIFSWLVSYTFEMRRTTTVFLPQYDNLWTILCLILYPLILIYINILNNMFLHWASIVALTLFMALVIFKLLQNFYSGPRSLLYLILYILTLEFLPFGTMFLSASFIS